MQSRCSRSSRSSSTYGGSSSCCHRRVWRSVAGVGGGCRGRHAAQQSAVTKCWRCAGLWSDAEDIGCCSMQPPGIQTAGPGCVGPVKQCLALPSDSRSRLSGLGSVSSECHPEQFTPSVESMGPNHSMRNTSGVGHRVRTRVPGTNRSMPLQVVTACT